MRAANCSSWAWPALGVALVLPGPGHAQAGPWVEHAVSTTVDSAYSVFAADFDGDHDIDMLAASFSSDTVTWHENVMGDGSVWSEVVISTQADGVVSVFGADLDGDGDLDALSAAENDDTIAWYENTLGDGSTWTEHIVSSTADFGRAVLASDIDGDGDMDVLSASARDAKIAWYDNVLGDGSLWVEKVITLTALRAQSVFAADIDGDGDMDVQSASLNDDTVAWYENSSGDGSTWVKRVISTNANGAFSVRAADLDGDGDQDVVSTSLYDDKVAWYENTNGDGSSWVEHVLTSSADFAHSSFPVDVDADGDLDVLSASSQNDTIAWFENLFGDGSSWATHTITTTADAATSVFAADVDGDGDTDALSTSAGLDRVSWYENLQLIVPFGSGVNPPTSLSILSGSSSIGDTLVFGVDNPLGTQAPGATAILALSLAPDPHFPGGTLLNGYGMAGPGAPGELLVSLAPSDFLSPLLGGIQWMGTGLPAPIPITVPDDASLVGTSLYAQGLLLDSSAAFGVRFGLTVGLRVTVDG